MTEKSTNNIFIENNNIRYDIEKMSDDNILEQLEKALILNLDINKSYGEYYNYFSLLHICALNGHFKSCNWLLKNGANPNAVSANGHTVFTQMIEFVKIKGLNIDDILTFSENLKKHGGDLSKCGYNNKSALELYYYYHDELDDKLIDYLIKNSDFENTFLLNNLLIDGNNFLSIEILKKIISHHNINLKKISFFKVDNTICNETYWNEIASRLSGSFRKKTFYYINWLHDNLGYNLDEKYVEIDFETSPFKNDKHKINLLGLAIKNKNKNLFDWVLKKMPHQINETFRVNEKEFSFLEYSLYCNFRTGIKLGLMENKDKLNQLDIDALIKLSDDDFTIDVFQKIYKSLLYRKINMKYNNLAKTTKRTKI